MSNKTHLFEFELKPVEEIGPWGEEPNLNLHWFALTDGTFKINAGKNILFRYSKDIIRHWNIENRDSDYYVVAFARDFLSATIPAITPLPVFLQPLAWNWQLLKETSVKSNEHESHYDAFRWLGERSPWASYLNACPEISFIRKENDILICWDNRNCTIDDIPVWQAEFGTHVISAEDYLQECHSFADRLLSSMYERIEQIASGKVTTQIAVDCADLFKQHETWKKEFSDYFITTHEPDIPWQEAKIAFDTILNDLKIKL